MAMSLRTMTIVLGSDSQREHAAIREFCTVNDLRCPDKDGNCDWVTLRIPESLYQRLSDALCAHGYKLELFRHATFTASSSMKGTGSEINRSGDAHLI